MARSAGISPAQLARLEAGQRGLYLEDFVDIAEALGEKPGNLLPNDIGEIGHLKPLINHLVSIKPEFLTRVTTIVGKILLLTEDVTAAAALELKQKALLVAAVAPARPRTAVRRRGRR